VRVISFVNGYLCTSSCDEAKARRGIDPHPKPDPTQPDGKADKSDRIRPASELRDPAVVFGGALAGMAAAAAGTAPRAGPPLPAPAQLTARLVDFLA
jgi:hypothetical protein